MLVATTTNPLEFNRDEWKDKIYSAHIVTTKINEPCHRLIVPQLDWMLDFFTYDRFSSLSDIDYAEHMIIEGDLC